ncbi:MAG: hypothetical protein LBJ43_02945 [Propionibacteriaceae bacterium]|jgi:hypothetical protein|nr:hypothetical protein [Propionibacteriaceae bacterium]
MRNISVRCLRLSRYAVLLVAAALCAAMLGGCSNQGDVATPPKSTGSVSSQEEEFDYGGFLKELQTMYFGLLTEFPKVQVVRFVAPAERPEAWKECMLAAGWAVYLTFDSGMAPPDDLPSDQLSAYYLDEYVCFAQFPIPPWLVQVFGGDQIRVVFDYYVNVLIPCLAERNIRVAEPPTWEVFRDSWVSDGSGGFSAGSDAWFPYGSVKASTYSETAWEELNIACPQNPSNEILWPNG